MEENKNNLHCFDDNQVGFDYLKIVLSLIILLRHVGQIIYQQDTVFYSVWTRWLSPVGVPCFFIISSFLFYRKEVTQRNLMKRICRILKLYIVWTLVYLPYHILMILNDDENLIRYIQSIFFEGSNFHLWYLPALIVGFLIVDVLIRFLGKGKTLIFSIILYIVGYVIENFNFIFNNTTGVKIIVEWYLKLFCTTRNGIFFAPIYIMVGYFVANSSMQLNKKLRIQCFVIVILGLILQYFESKIAGINMLLSCVITGSALVVISLNIVGRKGRVQNIIRYMSELIYFIHPWVIFIVSFLSRRIDILSLNWISCIVIVLVTCLVAYVGAKLKERKKWIGYFV